MGEPIWAEGAEIKVVNSPRYNIPLLLPTEDFDLDPVQLNYCTVKAPAQGHIVCHVCEGGHHEHIYFALEGYYS